MSTGKKGLHCKITFTNSWTLFPRLFCMRSTARTVAPAKLSCLSIGHSGKYHNTLCLSPKILHKHCFQFLSGFTMVPRENKNNAYAKFGGTNKEYYGIFRNGQLLCYYPGQRVYFFSSLEDFFRQALFVLLHFVISLLFLSTAII